MKRHAVPLVVALLLGPTACSDSSASLAPERSGLEGLALVSIDGGVTIAADNRTVTIKFIGGPLLAKTHPCYSEYKGWARLVGQQHLDLAVATVIDGRPDHGTACPAAGFERVVEVVLNSR